jgi:thiol-disulfide isomerase/thioredoxin
MFMLRANIVVGFWLAAAIVSNSEEASGQNPNPGQANLADRFRALDGEYQDKQKTYVKAFLSAKSEQERRDANPLAPDRLSFSKRMLMLADEDPKDQMVLGIVCEAFLLANTARFPLHRNRTADEFAFEQQALKDRSLEWLRRDYLLDPRLKDHIPEMAIATAGSSAEGFLRDVLARNPDHTVQGLACSMLASMMAWLYEAPELFAKNPDVAHDFEKLHGKVMLAWIKSHDRAAAEIEAVALHNRVLSQYADVRLYPAYPDDKRMIRRFSEDWLRGHRELVIGKLAPEIEGKDVDGNPIKKLSDYRGKVVALVFWASWCGPCMQEIPTDRELAESMVGRPFALLGVNCDYTPQDAKATMAKESINWPNWYDGDPRTDPPIQAHYFIQGIPAVFLLDAEGVIRGRDLRGQSLRDAIEGMVKERETRTERLPRP